MITIQPWAIAEAFKRAELTPLATQSQHTLAALNALALMIQTHETEPVPWDLKRAREICDARWPRSIPD